MTRSRTLRKGARAALSSLGLKQAEIVTPLQPHQQRVVDRISQPDQPGLVVVHGLGSGKTLTSIAAADALGLPADVVVPAALQANYQKELDTHAPKKSPSVAIQSLENAARKGAGRLANPLLIVDEAHRARNPGKTRQAISGARAKKKLLLTGSLLYNHPADMAPLINAAAGTNVLPASQAEFENKYVATRHDNPGFVRRLFGARENYSQDVNPREREKLRAILRRYVDFHPGSRANFPERTDERIDVPISAEQRQLYDALLARAPPWVAHKIRNQLPPSKAEAQQLNAFLSGVRQAVNTTAPFRADAKDVGPKLDRAVEELKKQLADPDARAVVYSNWLDAGVKPYAERLKRENIPFGVFSGDQPKRVRDQYVRDYNAGKLRALLLSGAGAEGLDLKGTRLIQVLDPHWNEERIKQVIGRGIRYKSHDHLPPEKRRVLVQRFNATMPRTGILESLRVSEPPPAIDAYLNRLALDKEELNRKFRALLEDQKNTPGT